MQDPLVRLLQHRHLALLLRRLKLPQEVESGGPFNLPSMRQHGDHEDDDPRQ